MTTNSQPSPSPSPASISLADADAADALPSDPAPVAASLFEVLFQSAPLPACVSRLSDGKLIAVNDAWLSLFGLTREAAIGRTTVELGHWASQEDRTLALNQWIAQDQSERQFHSLKMTYGQTHRVRMHGWVIQQQPEPWIAAFYTEATREWQTEQALRQTNLDLQQRVELHAAIEKLARVGHWSAATDKEGVHWSPGLYAISGFESQATMDRSCSRSGIHPDDLPAWLQARQACDGRELLARWVHPDGRMRWMRTRMSRTAVAGNPQAEFGVVQDVSAEVQARQALAHQLEFLQNIAAQLPGLIYQARLSPDGRSSITYVNAAVREVFELEPDELWRDVRCFLSRLHPDDKGPVLAALQVSARNLTPWAMDFRTHLPRKGLRWHRVQAMPQREADGSILWHGFIADVTELKLAAQRQERQQRMLAAVQQAQTIYIEAEDKRQAFEALLEALLSVTGSEYGFVGEVLYDPQGQPYLRSHAISPIAWNEATRKQYQEQHKQGLEFRNLKSLFGQALATAQPVIANDAPNDPRAGGTPPGHPALNAFLGVPLLVGERLVALVGLANQPGGYSQGDIDFLQPLLGAVRQLVLAWRGHAERARTRTQLAATSALLAEKSATLALALDSMSQGLCKIDRHGRVILYNQRLLELLDLPNDMLAARPWHRDVVRFQLERGDFGENLDWVDPHARAHIEQQQSGLSPEKYCRTTRLGRTLEIQSRQLPDGGMVRTYADVSPYIEVQQQVRRLNASLERRVAERTAELERAVQDVEEIAYSIAHDLRTPLRSINGFSSLIAEQEADRLSAQGRGMFERIGRTSRTMGQMLSDLLELLRVVRVELKLEPVDLLALAQEVIKALGSRAAAARVELLAMPTARADAGLLRLLLQQLLDNALKYASQQPQPVLQLGFDADQGAYFLRDNGCGFNMARADKLFGLFQRLHAGTDLPGTGMGLAIVARIVERHGGRIWAQSAPGAGATFWWTLPPA